MELDVELNADVADLQQAHRRSGGAVEQGEHRQALAGDAVHVSADIFGRRVEQTFYVFMRKPPPRKAGDSSAPPVAGIGASPTTNLAFPQIVAAYDARYDTRTPILSADEKKVFVDTFAKTGFTGGINWYRNFTSNWERSAGLDHHVRVPALMIMAENDAVLPPSAADGMERLVPDLEKYLVRDSGHWTQQEKPDEVSAKLIEWRRKRFG